jgi:hypothetical protein
MLAHQALDLHHVTRLVDDPTSIATEIVHATCNRGRWLGSDRRRLEPRGASRLLPPASDRAGADLGGRRCGVGFSGGDV